MEYCVGQSKLIQAELQFLKAKTRVAHAPNLIGSNNNQNRETKESKNGKWWSSFATN
jgi:hypothetical protein